jgi:hypothetical protein
MTEWKEFTGSDEQIAEINNSKSFLLKRKDGAISFVSTPPLDLDAMGNETTIEYLICNPHPLAEMICQQARTGQPVWVKFTVDLEHYGRCCSYSESTTSPIWDLPNAEYSFTPFDHDEVTPEPSFHGDTI